MSRRKKRFIVGCESSGVVREAMRRHGIDAWSCDLQPADDGSRYHLQGDVLYALKAERWDGAMMHPSCTYLSASGLHWNARGAVVDGVPRTQLTEEAVAFVLECVRLAPERFGLENPVGCLSTRWRKPEQIVQPYEYGHDASKKTCLWLRGLPMLVPDPAQYMPPRAVCAVCGFCRAAARGAAKMFKAGCARCGAAAGRIMPRWGNQQDTGQNKLSEKPGRWKERSRTYEGIAEAMAAQWAPIILGV